MGSSVTAESPHTSFDQGAATRLSLRQRAYAALLRRLERWFDLRLVWIFRRTITPGRELRADAGYSFREVTAAELLDASADPALELSRERIKDAAARGDFFFGVFHQGRLIAYRWYSLSGSTPCWEGMQIRYGHPQRAYGYRTFTHPAHRGKHLHAYATAQSDTALGARGCTHTIGYIDATNFASLRAYSHLSGGRRVGGIVTLRAFGRHWVLRTSGARRHDVTFVKI
jgi:hypothetical protein